MMIQMSLKCQWCAKEHETVCPMVKAIEFFDTGAIKRVEFKSGFDYYVPPTPPGWPPTQTPWTEVEKWR